MNDDIFRPGGRSVGRRATRRARRSTSAGGDGFAVDGTDSFAIEPAAVGGPSTSSRRRRRAVVAVARSRSPPGWLLSLIVVIAGSSAPAIGDERQSSVAARCGRRRRRHGPTTTMGVRAHRPRPGVVVGRRAREWGRRADAARCRGRAGGRGDRRHDGGHRRRRRSTTSTTTTSTTTTSTTTTTTFDDFNNSYIAAPAHPAPAVPVRPAVAATAVHRPGWYTTSTTSIDGRHLDDGEDDDDDGEGDDDDGQGDDDDGQGDDDDREGDDDHRAARLPPGNRWHAPSGLGRLGARQWHGRERPDGNVWTFTDGRRAV